MSEKISGIKGMPDLFDPVEVRKWLWIESTARNLFEKADFQEIRTPVLEEARLFERSVGDSTEIVEKEMYILEDRNGKRLALRPECTASVARAFIEHFTSHQVMEGRFFYLGPMYRYERPQQGRYRQFHQIGAEVFGFDHPLLDADVIALAHQFFIELGIDSIQLQLNSLGSKECRKRYRDALQDFLGQIEGKLCADCQHRIQRNPLRALDCKVPGCIEATAKAPLMLDFLSEESRKNFEMVQWALRERGVPFQVQPRLVRGLDYYEKTVFEFTSPELGAQNSVAGGGRYNGLVYELGGPSVPAVGFAVGMERLAALLKDSEISTLSRARVYLIGLDEDSDRYLYQLLPAIREAGAISQLDLGGASLKGKMRRASDWQAQWVVIVGEAERQKGVVMLKNMAEGSQEEVQQSEVLSKLMARFPTLHYS